MKKVQFLKLPKQKCLEVQLGWGVRTATTYSANEQIGNTNRKSGWRHTVDDKTSQKLKLLIKSRRIIINKE